MLRVGGSSRGHFCLHVAVQIQAESDCPHTQTHTETHIQRSRLISAVCGQMPAGVSEADGQDCFSRLHRVAVFLFLGDNLLRAPSRRCGKCSSRVVLRRKEARRVSCRVGAVCCPGGGLAIHGRARLTLASRSLAHAWRLFRPDVPDKRLGVPKK